MINTIINLLPVLAVAILLNIGLGMYYKIGVESVKFNVKILISGAIKAGIIAGSFVGLGYIFGSVDLSELGLTPDLMINSAIILYTGKAMINLAKILKIKIPTVNLQEEKLKE